MLNVFITGYIIIDRGCGLPVSLIIVGASLRCRHTVSQLVGRRNELKDCAGFCPQGGAAVEEMDLTMEASIGI